MRILTTVLLVSFALPALAGSAVSNEKSTAKICAVANVQLPSEEGTTNFVVRGNDDCSQKFVDLASSEFRGADGETGNSDQEIMDSLINFQTEVQGICDTVNNSEQGQSKIQIQNNSTTSGFYFGTGERVHMDFEARCFLK
jgi:hypothetical protein